MTTKRPSFELQTMVVFHADSRCIEFCASQHRDICLTIPSFVLRSIEIYASQYRVLCFAVPMPKHKAHHHGAQNSPLRSTKLRNRVKTFSVYQIYFFKKCSAEPSRRSLESPGPSKIRVPVFHDFSFLFLCILLQFLCHFLLLDID